MSINYISREELLEKLLFKRIVKWDKDKLVLSDGLVVTIEMSESDCCAFAGGLFKDVKLDAVITNVELGEETSYYNGDYTTNSNTLTFFHNLNPIAVAHMAADDGNGGYYYSVGSVVIKNDHYPVVRA